MITQVILDKTFMSVFELYLHLHFSISLKLFLNCKIFVAVVYSTEYNFEKTNV